MYRESGGVLGQLSISEIEQIFFCYLWKTMLIHQEKSRVKSMKNFRLLSFLRGQLLLAPILWSNISLPELPHLLLVPQLSSALQQHRTD